MKFNWVVVLLMTELVFSSCNRSERNQAISDNEEESAWVAMDSFHLTLSEAFHPYQDSANLNPVRQLEAQLVKEAEMLSSATLPDHVNDDVLREQLNQLKSDTRHLAELISDDATEEEIGTALEILHARFHTMMEAFHRNDKRSLQ
jgi:hypothetical protein